MRFAEVAQRNEHVLDPGAVPSNVRATVAPDLRGGIGAPFPRVSARRARARDPSGETPWALAHRFALDTAASASTPLGRPRFHHGNGRSPAYVYVPLGPLVERRHGFCYRLFNLTRSDPHAFAARGSPPRRRCRGRPSRLQQGRARVAGSRRRAIGAYPAANTTPTLSSPLRHPILPAPTLSLSTPMTSAWISRRFGLVRRGRIRPMAPPARFQIPGPIGPVPEPKRRNRLSPG